MVRPNQPRGRPRSQDILGAGEIDLTARILRRHGGDEKIEDPPLCVVPDDQNRTCAVVGRTHVVLCDHVVQHSLIGLPLEHVGVEFARVLTRRCRHVGHAVGFGDCHDERGDAEKHHDDGQGPSN